MRDIGILVPDETVRQAITQAADLVAAPSIAADGCSWEFTPREVQLMAMTQLRQVLGAYLRIEPSDAESAIWLERIHAGLREQWRSLDQEDRARQARG